MYRHSFVFLICVLRGGSDFASSAHLGVRQGADMCFSTFLFSGSRAYHEYGIPNSARDIIFT